MEEELFNIKSRFGEYPSYRVTKSGKVFSYRQGNILKPLSVVLDSSGYQKDSNIINGIKTHQKRYGYYWEYASV